ncbi:MAG: heme ABC exporter ATP-binding protein CcmA [Hyphomicrobiaceae bacterium]
MVQLRLVGLSVGRGDRTLIEGLDLALPSGQALVIKGRNGAGKTTLLRTIAGFLSPLAGAIAHERVAGTAASGSFCADPDAAVAENAHYVGHHNAIKPTLTASENLMFWSRYLDPEKAVAAGHEATIALGRVGLAALHAIPAAYMSAGQRRRLSLARLLVARRPLWLLDEPTVSLDAEGTGMLATLVAEHCAAGGIVLAATHIELELQETRELRLGGSGEGSWALS